MKELQSMSWKSLRERVGAGLLGLGLVAGLVVISASPAAAGSGSVSARDGVLYDDCRDHTYRYSVNPGSSDWSLDVELIGPDGTSADFDFLSGGSDPTSGTGGFFFCGWERPGRYEIHATLTWYDEDYYEYTDSLPVDAFRMRKPRSRTSIEFSDPTPHYNEIIKIRTQTKDERPHGFFPAGYPWVRLQLRTRSGWVNVNGSKELGNERGVTTWRYRWNTNRTYKIRAVSLRDSDYESSVSRVVTVDPRRNGRTATAARAVTPWI
jgi:hypothetical protein